MSVFAVFIWEGKTKNRGKLNKSHKYRYTRAEVEVVDE